MIRLIKRFVTNSYSRYFGMCVGFAMLSSSVVFAGDGDSLATDITIPDGFANFNWSSAISTIGDKLQPAIIAALGVAVGVWIVQLVWRKTRSVMG